MCFPVTACFVALVHEVERHTSNQQASGYQYAFSICVAESACNVDERAGSCFFLSKM